MSHAILCGVPYAALSLASGLSLQQKMPMIMRRKERKAHGTMKLFEGEYKQNQIVLVIEDVIVSGASIIETTELLRKEGLIVKEAVVLLDREQGGLERCLDRGIKVFPLLKASDLRDILVDANKITYETMQSTKLFLQENQCSREVSNQGTVTKRPITAQHPVARNLMEIIQKKKSNLCVAIDETSSAKFLRLVEEIGPHACIIKTHIDMMEDFTPSVIRELKSLSVTHNFLIFEDRKFCDVGNTVRVQYTGGVYGIKNWADIVTVQGIPGPGILEALDQCLSEKDEKAFILVAEMSSEGTLAQGSYSQEIVKMAKENDNVIGFVSQTKVCDDAKFLQFTPGISLDNTGTKGFGQKYKDPYNAVVLQGADIAIVGRGITKSTDVSQAAARYKKECYENFLKAVNIL